jgi:hypothetical protein
MKTTKPLLVAFKPRVDSQSKLSVLSENNSEWHSLNKPTLSISSETSGEISIPVFRRRSDIEDEEDMYLIKRANPVYDSDDDDTNLFTPAKRQRTGEPTMLSWYHRVDEDETDGFTFSEASLMPH